MYSLARPFLFRLDAERAHGLGLQALEAGLPQRPQSAAGRARPSRCRPRPSASSSPTRSACAAGLDKNGAHIDALLALGFGFVEVGTITPRPQAGNPKPRMFRLPEHSAVINRLGFNNDGVDALVRNVEQARRRKRHARHQHRQEQGHARTRRPRTITCYCLERVYPLADYITVNISSPNTAGLRDLQEEETLRRLVGDAARGAGRARRAARPARADAGEDRAGPVATTTSTPCARVLSDAAGRWRDRHQHHDRPHAGRRRIRWPRESRRPVRRAAVWTSRRPCCACCARAWTTAIPLIGVGGILSGADAAGKIAAGAQLVQFYTGLIYRGPDLIGECVDAIRRRREGVPPHERLPAGRRIVVARPAATPSACRRAPR